jgi:Acyltransferase family.
LTKASSRSVSADFIKSISIFGAVFVHSFGILCNLSGFDIDMTYTFRFCVPAFIALWAYFLEISYSRKNKSERLIYLKYRFIHLFRIYFIWSLIYFITIAQWQVSFVKNITMYFAGFGFAGQYFFLLLFQLLILHPFLRVLYLKRALRLITISIILLVYILYGYYQHLLPNLLLKIGERLFLFWIPSVFLGIAMVHGKIIKIPLMMSLSILLIPIECYILKRYNLNHFTHITPVVLISSILFCISIMQNEHLIKTVILKLMKHETLTYISSNSILIFVLNPMLCAFFLQFNFSNYFNFSYVENIILGSIVAITIMFFCLVIGEFFRKIGLGKIVF